jgi:hypothetical protein
MPMLAQDRRRSRPSIAAGAESGARRRRFRLCHRAATAPGADSGCRHRAGAAPAAANAPGHGINRGTPFSGNNACMTPRRRIESSHMKLTDTATIECHPPERRRRTEIRMCHGSCCCCCCCLHTVGGIVGAAVAPKRGGPSTAWSHLSLIEYWDEEYEPGPTNGAKVDPEAITEKTPASPGRPIIRAGAVPDIAKSGVSAVKVFWLLSLTATILGALIGITQGANGFVVGLVILALVFPAIQLGCAIITAVWIAFSSRPDQSFQKAQVGRITLGLVLGTIGGILVMVGIGVLMSLMSR